MKHFSTHFTPENSSEDRVIHIQPRVICNDSLLAADPLRSAIYLQDKSTFRLGDYIHFRVVLFNGYGKPMVTGGDHLRARLFNDTLGAYTSGKVIDQQNGTYTLIFRALWIGTAQLEVTLLYTKEVIATAIRLRKLWDFSDIRAGFVSKNNSESTKCSPDYKTTARQSKISKVCDFSYWKKSMKWYCAMPNNNMTCKDWVSISVNWENFTKGVNKCEEELSIKRKDTIIPSNISVRILQISSKDAHYKDPESDIPCSKYNTTKLWHQTAPVGYFYENKWILMHCKGITTFDGECLRNKTVILWGDSTLYQWFSYFKSQLKAKGSFVCKLLTNAKHEWQKTTKCYHRSYNVTLYFSGHNIPVSDYKTKNLYNFFNENFFEKVISTSKTYEFLLVIHLFAHVQYYNFDFFTGHFIEIKRFLKRISKTNIKLPVFIKLPHTYRRYKDSQWMLRENDYTCFMYTDILRRVFEGIYDKVVVLDQKDATIATRSTNLHPSGMIVQEMVHQLMSYVC